MEFINLINHNSFIIKSYQHYNKINVYQHKFIYSHNSNLKFHFNVEKIRNEMSRLILETLSGGITTTSDPVVISVCKISPLCHIIAYLTFHQKFWLHNCDAIELTWLNKSLLKSNGFDIKRGKTLKFQTCDVLPITQSKVPCSMP